MNLALDIGNNYFKIGIYKNSDLIYFFSESNSKIDCVIKKVFSEYSDVSYAIISNVSLVNDVDLFSDWLIVSNFQVVSDLVENSITIEKNEFGKIQILKAQGQKCDRCWHYQKETFSGIQNTKLCKRCSNIINLEFN